jgi:hypothetical protein
MSFNYLPIPPRVWSRVQNQCTYTVDSSYNSTFVPLINKTLPPPEAIFLDKQLYKGNILQYKGNSSRLTKNQKYSQISKGFGPNRTKVFATQGITYTNPNTTSLKRVNSVNIPFPNQIVGFPNNISGPYQYNVPNPNDCPTNYLQDGGNLVCNSYVNPCTGQVIQNVSQQQCFPTYCSDVPGKIIDLCWNPKVQTWFPRNNLTNNNSTSKWPVNYKGFVSAVTPEAPVLLTAVGGCGIVDLTWSYVLNICIPISSFYIYQDGKLVKVVPYTITSTTINNLNFNTTYTFYIIALSNTTQSEPSNTLSATTIVLPEAPVLLTAVGGCGIVDLTWSYVLNICISSFYIYQDGELVKVVPYTITSTTINNLNFNTTYTFYIIALGNTTQSEPSNSLSATTIPLPSSPTNLQATTPTTTSINLTWNPVNENFILGYNIYNAGDGSLAANVTPASVSSYTFTGLITGNTYSYYIKSYNICYTSNASNSVIVTLLPLYSVIGSYELLNGFLYFKSTTSTAILTFNYDVSVNFTLVGGGGGGGSFAQGSAGTPGGGGGCIISTPPSTPIFLSAGSYFNITVGAGGAGGNTSIDGQPGGDTSITGTSSITTNNSVYGGGGGFGKVNVASTAAFNPQPSNGSPGGAYGGYLACGGGGAGGTLVYFTQPSTYTYVSGGGFGIQGDPVGNGGSGGNGNVGIDSNTYGGGGGGGAYSSSGGPYFGGPGGTGGGAPGINSNGIQPAASGTPNTGGGGGGTTTNIVPTTTVSAGSGGNGVAIFTVTLA